MVRILIWGGELGGIIMFVVFRQYQAGVFFCFWHLIRFFLHSLLFLRCLWQSGLEKIILSRERNTK
ncbi:hypothetical protein P167DRAFT_298170 [Morchella conica CCBAS932]|uniref:Uncharacterized protein n=1 Tax=Morchella conica CCBAS932 TaxID=1392247 RepID=A0A3N4KG20_9PEZI|nr:hypothetical protein P167DRAFT_298170 [Morchella conica CCBAS932]